MTADNNPEAMHGSATHREQPPLALCCRTAVRSWPSTRRILERSVVISGSSPTSDASGGREARRRLSARTDWALAVAVG